VNNLFETTGYNENVARAAAPPTTPEELPDDGHRVWVSDLHALLAVVEAAAPTDLPVRRGLIFLKKWLVRDPGHLVTEATFS
jgi:hypothetical protein